jgi:hypothetical protein
MFAIDPTEPVPAASWADLPRRASEALSGLSDCSITVTLTVRSQQFTLFASINGRHAYAAGYKLLPRTDTRVCIASASWCSW